MRKTALIALLVLGFPAVSAPLMAADELPKAQAPSPEFSYKFRRGGSFSLEPALLIPSAPLDKTLNNALGFNVNFDIGVSPDISVVFGGGYYNLKGVSNPDFFLVICPGYGGIKSKNQFLPTVEVWWEADAAVFYEKSYLIQHSTGAMENLDGGGILGAGFDVWWTRWLMSGFNMKENLIVEDGQIFPFMQIGLRVGIRG